LAAILVLYCFETIKRRKANTKAYQKLSKPNRQIIDIVLETEKTATPTLGGIAATYKNRTGEPVQEEKLLQRLTEAEKTDIIKSAIASVQDEPTRVWKTQISRKIL